MTRIEFLTPAGDAPVTAVADLVNKVYASSEQGLWLDGTDRTSAAEVAAMISAGELVAAREDGRVVAVVRLVRWDDDSAEFGMLAADPAVQGRGVGRELVAWCEDTARRWGLRFMRLELQVPRTMPLESKQVLAAWYTRLGYELVRVGHLEEQFPHLVPRLAVEADYRIYRKTIVQPKG